MNRTQRHLQIWHLIIGDLEDFKLNNAESILVSETALHIATKVLSASSETKRLVSIERFIKT